MTQRITDILNGCGNGNPTVSLGPADAQSIGLEPGSYEAKAIRKALGEAEKKATAAEKKAAAAADN